MVREFRPVVHCRPRPGFWTTKVFETHRPGHPTRVLYKPIRKRSGRGDVQIAVEKGEPGAAELAGYITVSS